MPSFQTADARSRIVAATAALEALPGGPPGETDLEKVAALLEAHPDPDNRAATGAGPVDRAAALLTVARSTATAWATADASRRLDDELNRHLGDR